MCVQTNEINGNCPPLEMHFLFLFFTYTIMLFGSKCSNILLSCLCSVD